MIAFARPHDHQPAAESKPSWHSGFMALLPDIRRHVRFAFRRLQADRREEAIQEALANAMVAYIRLFELGKTDVAYASPLADYAVRQVCQGRQIACPLNCPLVVLFGHGQWDDEISQTSLRRSRPFDPARIG